VRSRLAPEWRARCGVQVMISGSWESSGIRALLFSKVSE